MRKYIFIFSVLLLMATPNAQALDAIPEWETTCFNSTHIRKFTNTTNPNDGSVIYSAVDILKCPYECNEFREICNKWPGDAMPGEYFMLFQIVALGLLFVGLVRIEEKSKNIRVIDIVIPLMSVVLFFSLALQGNNVIDLTTGEAVPVIFIVWFDYGMGTFSLIPFFLNVFKYLKAVLEEGDKI